MSVKKVSLILFVAAFLYMAFFSIDVPPFWDDYCFLDAYAGNSFTHYMKDLFKLGSDKFFYSERPLFALWTKVVMNVSGINFYLYRIFRCINFAIFVALMFLFIDRFLKNRWIAVWSSVFAMFSLPIYIHTLQYVEPFVFAEAFKIIAFWFFLKDYYREERSSIFLQLGVCLAALFAVRAYDPCYSIGLIIFLFVLFSRPGKLRRYLGLIIFLFAINFPKGIHYANELGTPWGLNLSNIPGFIFGSSFLNLFYPIPSIRNLYYKPLIGVYGGLFLWAVILVLIGNGVLRKKIKYRVENKFHLFLLCWILGEIPLWFVLPETATRYLSSVMIPLTTLCLLAIIRFRSVFQGRFRYVLKFIVSIVLVVTITFNMLYVYIFRGTWGSSFIGYSKTADYVESIRDKNAVVMYYAGSAAREYFPVDKSKRRFCFKQDVKYQKTFSESDLRVEGLKKISGDYNELYVIKRITSFTRSQFPSIDYSNNRNVQLVNVIYGEGDFIYDRLNKFLVKLTGINYLPNEFRIYKLEKKGEDGYAVKTI